jgi:glycosyltransferase involved in cell wall biosynthesis
MIAIVYPQFYGVGGIARYLESFLANLPDGQPRVILITGEQHGPLRSYPNAQIIHVPMAANRAGLFTWGLAVKRLLRQLYREGRIQCMNLHAPPLIPGLLLPPEIPLVLTAHTTYLGMSGRFYPERHYDSQWSAASLLIKMWMERRILARTAKVITLTEQGRQEVVAYGYKGPIAVIPNGADTRTFNPDTSQPKTIDVLFCGRIEKRKGSRPMVSVCKSLVAARPSIRICIVGYGDDEAWVREQLQPYGVAVDLAGKVTFDKMTRYYNQSRVYVSTSYYEGLPGTCLEAMAMALPAVVWDFLFYRGLVLPGKTGYTAPPNDFASMTREILRLLEDPNTALEFGRNGRELLAARYEWGGLARQLSSELSATGATR